MAQYSDELKEEIRSSSDIVDVISQYVILKRSGRNYFGLCPFHNEKSPSFSVSPERQYFHCFGCGKGGDVFTFVSEIEKISFKESIELLAERAKIALPTIEGDEYNSKQYLKDKMFKINLDAALFFHERLYKPLAKEAQNYVKQRKLDNTTLKNFKIGYSGNYNELFLFLKSKGYTEKEILSTGLVNKNDRGEFIDRFRKRLMFPIITASGKVVAFGGRRLDDNEKSAKYINSNENLIYSKKRHLFALNLAKKSQENRIILVEGYMDAISLHQRGIDNAVASLGTALTEEQARLLARYSSQVIISYDADGAGQTAILRAMELLSKIGVDARVLQMDGAKDPDEFVVKYGTGKFKLLVDNSISLVEFRIKMLKTKYNLDVAKDKVEFMKQITKILTNVNNSVEREIYIDKISNKYKISKNALFAEVNKIIYSNQPKVDVLEKRVTPVEKKVEETSEIILKREKMVLYLLINYYDDTYSTIKNEIEPDDFVNSLNKIIFTKIIESEENEKEKILNIISNIEDVNIQSHISEIMVTDYQITSVDKALEDIVNIYSKEKLNKKKNEIIKKLDNSQEYSQEEIKNLEKELSNVIIELAKRK